MWREARGKSRCLNWILSGLFQVEGYITFFFPSKRQRFYVNKRQGSRECGLSTACRIIIRAALASLFFPSPRPAKSEHPSGRREKAPLLERAFRYSLVERALTYSFFPLRGLALGLHCDLGRCCAASNATARHKSFIRSSAGEGWSLAQGRGPLARRLGLPTPPRVRSRKGPVVAPRPAWG